VTRPLPHPPPINGTSRSAGELQEDGLVTHGWATVSLRPPPSAYPAEVWIAFLGLVSSLDVTVLGTSHHVFPGGALTGLVLLGESHAAIHTWPEHEAAWGHIACCGDRRLAVVRAFLGGLGRLDSTIGGGDEP
jgi:hypothetical protein